MLVAIERFCAEEEAGNAVGVGHDDRKPWVTFVVREVLRIKRGVVLPLVDEDEPWIDRIEIVVAAVAACQLRIVTTDELVEGKSRSIW